MKTLDGKLPQPIEDDVLVFASFQHFLDTNNGDDDRTAAQRGKKSARRTVLIAGYFALECDQKRGIQKDRPDQLFDRRRPRPLPALASPHAIRSSVDLIGPPRSINSRTISDFVTLSIRAIRVNLAACFLSSFTVIVGMVIPLYYVCAQGEPYRFRSSI